MGDIVAAHYEDMLDFYGVALGLKMARKHLGWYLEVADLTQYRIALLTDDNPKAVLSGILSAFANQQVVT